MLTNLDKTLRNGGMSRRGFLRAMGVTAASVTVPGLIGPRFESVPLEPIVWQTTNIIHRPINMGKSFQVQVTNELLMDAHAIDPHLWAVIKKSLERVQRGEA